MQLRLEQSFRLFNHQRFKLVRPRFWRLSLIALSTFSLGGCFMGAYHPYNSRLSEAKQNVGSMNRAQQAYFLEQNKFSNSVSALGLGIQLQTKYYQYSTQASPSNAINYGIALEDRSTRYFGPIPYEVKGNFYSVVGGVFLVPGQGKGEATTVAILCQAIEPLAHHRPLPPTLKAGKPVCTVGTKELP